MSVCEPKKTCYSQRAFLYLTSSAAIKGFQQYCVVVFVFILNNCSDYEHLTVARVTATNNRPVAPPAEAKRKLFCASSSAHGAGRERGVLELIQHLQIITGLSGKCPEVVTRTALRPPPACFFFWNNDVIIGLLAPEASSEQPADDETVASRPGWTLLSNIPLRFSTR